MNSLQTEELSCAVRQIHYIVRLDVRLAGDYNVTQIHLFERFLQVRLLDQYSGLWHSAEVGLNNFCDLSVFGYVFVENLFCCNHVHTVYDFVIAHNG